jgi:timeless protein
MSSTVVGRQTIFELSQLVVSGKEAFADSRNIRALMDYMKCILEKVIIS